MKKIVLQHSFGCALLLVFIPFISEAANGIEFLTDNIFVAYIENTDSTKAIPTEEVTVIGD
jgi:hypothetical protein